jgi:hypothetical protein
MPPTNARNTSELPATSGMRRENGLTAAVKSGRAAPTANVAAEVRTA